MTAMPRSATSSAISLRASAPVLVGRDDELATLLQIATHPPSIAVIEGEAGVGKTRLAHELVTNPVLGRKWVAWGACQPFREAFPYGPVIEALRGAGPRLPSASQLNPVIGALRPLLPEIAPQLPAQPKPLGEPQAERHRLFRAFRELLDSCGPTVLVLEDLHWADEGSRELVRFLTAAPCSALSTVLTFRDGGASALTGTYRGPENLMTAMIKLAPLDRVRVRCLATSLLGGLSVSADFADRLHERTAGIPFVVEETLRLMRAPADAVDADGSRARHLVDELEVPGPLRQATEERLAALSRSAVEVVHAIAVLGVAETAGTLSEVADLELSQVNAGLLEALRVGALLEPERNRYGFRHALARQAVYDAIPGPQRQRLHLHAATVLGARTAPPLGQVAEHYRAADRLPEWRDAAEAAADQADERGDSGLASEILLDLLEEPTSDGDRMDRLATKLSKAALGAVGQRHVTDVLGRVLNNERLSRQARNGVRLHRGLLLTRQPGGVEAGRADLALAVDELHDTDPDAALYGMSVLAKANDGAVPYREHARWMDRVDEALARTANPEVVANVLANQLHALVQTGSPAAEEKVAQLPTTSGSRAETRHLTRAHLNLGDAYTWVGEYERARRFLATGLRLADDGGPPYLFSIAEATTTHLDWWTGRWSGLRDRAERLLAQYVDLRDITSELSLVLGSLASANGEWEIARDHLRRPSLVDHTDSCTPMVIAATAAMTHLLLSNDEDQEAWTEAARGLDIVRRKGIWLWGARLVPEAVQACCRTGRRAQAHSLLGEFDAGIEGRLAPLGRAASLHGHGILRRCSEDALERAAAERYFEDARAAYAALPAPYYATLCAEQAAHCRLAHSELEPTPLLEPIIAAFDELGAVRDAARCRHFLRTAGHAAPSRRGRRGYGTALSPREREVAKLIALGHTNRSIAEVLFLSPRTVEHHVAKVLRKLGARTRGELSTEMIR